MMRRGAKAWRVVTVGVIVAAAGCATLASEAGDDDAVRPNARAGPFRALRDGELLTKDEPYVLKQKHTDFREPTLLALEVGLGKAVMYAVADVGGRHGIYRFSAPDARSFDEEPEPPDPVIEPDQVWEGATLSGPSVAEVDGEVWLFYAGAEGIGLARSSDGQSFVKHSGPVLGLDPQSVWEAGAVPVAPGFVRVGVADFRLFFEAGGRLGEARSSDGENWQRLGDAPVLEPAVEPADAFDAATVGDPEALVALSAEGRRIVRVYYTGRAPDGSTAIGLAARFGATGRLSRAPAPAFTGPRGPRAPAVLSFATLTLLFATQRAGSSDSQDFPAIAGGVAPATISLSTR